MTSVSAGHIILTPTQSVMSGWPQWGSNPRPPHQGSRALPTDLPPPPPPLGHESLEYSQDLLLPRDGCSFYILQIKQQIIVTAYFQNSDSQQFRAIVVNTLLDEISLNGLSFKVCTVTAVS